MYHFAIFAIGAVGAHVRREKRSGLAKPARVVNSRCSSTRQGWSPATFYGRHTSTASGA